MVVKQLCRKQIHPGSEMEKCSAIEGGYIWLLKTMALALHNFSCCLIWTLSYIIVYLLCHLESYFTLSKM